MRKGIQVGFLLLLLLAPITVFGAARTRRLVATCTGSNPVPRLHELPLL